MSWLLLGTFAALSILGVPLAVALGLAAMFVLQVEGIPLSVVSQAMYTSVNSFLLIAIPLFILAGHVMERGGLSERIFEAANVVVGRWRGGLGHVNIAASFIFGGISGSAIADVASLGPLEIRAMTERGYPRDYAAGLTMTTATLASIVPPSILMIIAASAAGQSVGGALAGGVGPAIILAMGFVLINYVIARRNGYGVMEPPRGFSQSARTIGVALPALGAPIIILGGMFSGIVTPTEAAGLAAFYTFLVGFVFYGGFKLREVPGILISAGRTTGTVLLIMMSASVATYVFTIDRLPQKVSEAILSVSADPTIILLLMGVIFLIVGMFMEIIAAGLILIPVLFPVAVSVGIDPLHFIVFLVTGLSLGLATPPVGVCLFATAQISGLPIEKLVRVSLPFYACSMVIYLSIAIFPEIVLLPIRILMH
ncbi:TRAP transporter large permease [Pikeienuella sp. HZG-20]|uniref:TRAP transporter large permease n=1 Tax=Paludibacillus litoralis TaxID=3133267 RepID=UPI0030ED4913